MRLTQELACLENSLKGRSKPISWLQVQIPVNAKQAASVEQLLLDVGALSVTLIDSEDQAIFEPGPGETPIWDLVTVVGLFPGDSPRETLEQDLNTKLASLHLAPCTLLLMEDQDWERAWLDDFKPMCFADRLWVCPTGLRPAESNQGVIMELDPGLAFGTGTHPTTALCLEWLAQNELSDKTLIDYGCGSGILGIAALLLGAQKVYGVDNDPQALQASGDNCEKNSLDRDRFPLYLPGDFANALSSAKVHQVDIVLANILAGPLVSLAEYLAAMVLPEGKILLSGILREQAEEVMAAYGNWFTVDDPVFQGDWTRLSGTRNSSH